MLWPSAKDLKFGPAFEEPGGSSDDVQREQPRDLSSRPVVTNALL